MRRVAAPPMPSPPAVPGPCPLTAPAANTGSVVYIVNSSGAGDTVTPWTPNTTYFDDELCHENLSGLGLTATAATVPCGQTAPSGSSWFTSRTSSMSL